MRSYVNENGAEVARTSIYLACGHSFVVDFWVAVRPEYRCADCVRDALQPLGHDLRVLDKIGQVVDDPGGNDLVVGEAVLFEHLVFVLMARVGERQHDPADIRL